MSIESLSSIIAAGQPADVNRDALAEQTGQTIDGVGRDAGSASQTDDVNLMDTVQFLKRWDQFNGTYAFDLADETVPIVGKKR